MERVMLFLSGIGLIAGMYGCFLTIRRGLINIYTKLEMFFSLWPENRKLFRRKDEVIFKIARTLFGKVIFKKASLSTNVETLREGNEIVVGLSLILLGFLSQFVAIILTILKYSK